MYIILKNKVLIVAISIAYMACGLFVFIGYDFEQYECALFDFFDILLENIVNATFLRMLTAGLGIVAATVIFAKVTEPDKWLNGAIAVFIVTAIGWLSAPYAAIEFI